MLLSFILYNIVYCYIASYQCPGKYSCLLESTKPFDGLIKVAINYKRIAKDFVFQIYNDHSEFLWKMAIDAVNIKQRIDIIQSYGSIPIYSRNITGRDECILLRREFVKCRQKHFNYIDTTEQKEICF